MPCGWIRAYRYSPAKSGRNFFRDERYTVVVPMLRQLWPQVRHQDAGIEYLATNSDASIAAAKTKMAVHGGFAVLEVANIAPSG